MFTLACHAITEYRMGRTRLIENSKHFMTNNINQQKFTVLLKHPKEHEIITFKRSLKGGREEYFIFSKKEKHISTTKKFFTWVQQYQPCRLLLRLLVFRLGGNIVNNGVTSPQQGNRYRYDFQWVTNAALEMT